MIMIKTTVNGLSVLDIVNCFHKINDGEQVYKLATRFDHDGKYK